MSKEIEGIVKRNPVMLEECCIFPVEQEDGTYLVVSLELQAVKDHIFVKEGQKIRIRGSDVEHSDCKGIIMAEEAKLRINDRADASVEEKRDS